MIPVVRALRWNGFRKVSIGLLLSVAVAGLNGCAYQSAPGPYAKRLANPSTTVLDAGIKLVEVDSASVQRLAAMSKVRPFSEVFGDGVPVGTVFGKGDSVAVTIWEAPPAALFAGMSSTGLAPTNAPAGGVPLPEQVVNGDGMISVPFAGQIRVAGRTPAEVEREIKARLYGKANQPQVIVRIAGNAAANATIVGDVERSVRLPLGARGERLLDAVAAAGGVRQPINRMTLQVTRGQTIRMMPLADVIADPRQNVILQSGDVVTALYQPYSFTVLGATGKNEEVTFEATGLTLSQALGRAGGLVDNRADAKGVFIFRYEDPEGLTPDQARNARRTSDGRIPVIYRINLKDPGAFFLAQEFPMRNRDLIYVSNASFVDLQRFVALLGGIVGPTATAVSIGNVLN